MKISGDLMCVVADSWLGLLVGGAYNNSNNAGLWLSNANNGSDNDNNNVGSRKLIKI